MKIMVQPKEMQSSTLIIMLSDKALDIKYSIYKILLDDPDLYSET